MEKNCEPPIGRKGDSGGEIIGLAGMARDFGQEFAVGKLRRVWRILRREERCQAERKEKKKSAAIPSMIFHGGRINDSRHSNMNRVLPGESYTDSLESSALQKMNNRLPINLVRKEL